MCGMTGVAGAAGSGVPLQAAATTTGVAGAAGAPAQAPPAPMRSGGGCGPEQDATQVGGAADAATGSKMVAGGGGTDLKAALEALLAALRSLADVVSKMQVSGGGGCDMPGHKGHVAGVQGGPATSAQFVARAVPAASAQGTGEDDPFEARVLELINQERSRAGLAPVRYNGRLDGAAEKHARHMSIVGKMAHDGIGDGDPGERIRAEGFRSAWGENVATGQTSPEQVVREWMNSPTHRRNIMDPNFRQMGVGQVSAADGRTYWAQEFGA